MASLSDGWDDQEVQAALVASLNDGWGDQDVRFSVADWWDERQVQAALRASRSDGWGDLDVGLSSCSSPSSSSWEPLRTTEEQARSEAHE